ncbi:hypothetical protein Patl1_28475 [Pistacia atlantica]|uniref:Uncharacterized protein n=1 Tax=Pistacia atlantica TaxID=434234 RepID=A0ACC1BFR7_9ROSI|nr:hypothetical protein Patl1_28475 [Pistacia atlantica]
MGVVVHTIVAPIEGAKLLLPTQDSNLTIVGSGRRKFKDSSRLESDLEELNCSLDLVASQLGQGKAIEDSHADCSKDGEDQSDMIKIHEDQKFELLELESDIEKNNVTTLNSLQDLNSMSKL